MYTNFFDSLMEYPLSYRQLESWIDGQMIEPVKTIEQERELIYKYIKKCGFRVFVDFLAMRDKVVVDLYFLAQPVKQYEEFYSINEVYKKLFEDAFKELEEWDKQRLEQGFNKMQSTTLDSKIIEELSLSHQE